MVAFTDPQLINIAGWINYRMNFVNNKINEAIANPDTRAQARLDVRDAMLQIYRVLITVGQRNGFTLPTQGYTDQELSSIGLNP